MPAKPTVYDVARHAQVGIATVSRVLNGSARVSETARAAVLAAVAATGYRRNQAARRLARGGASRPRVAALLPLFSADFYAAVARTLARGLAEVGMDLLLVDVIERGDKLRHLQRILEEHACDALVLCSMGVGTERQAQLRRAGIPLVVIDYDLPDCVSGTVDNRTGGSLATRHLLLRGSRRPALLGGPASIPAFRARAQGFIDAAGTDAPRITATGADRTAGRVATTALLAEHPDIDGLMCVSDLYALGALEALRAAGRAVPAAVQVIGFDDQPLMDVIGLSTIRQPMAEMGAWAAKTAARLVADPAAVVPARSFPLVLVERSTTR